jgi:hypothetical protein
VFWITIFLVSDSTQSCSQLPRLLSVPLRPILLHIMPIWGCRMLIRKSISGLILGALLTCEGTLFSQRPDANSAGSEPLPVGTWESTQPDGTRVGMDLSVIPASVPDAVYPEGTPRPLGSRLQIGIFVGHSQMAHHVENFFVTGWAGPGSENGFATYANRRLEIYYRDPRSDFETHIELVLDPTKDEWTGRFHRGSFDRQVTLERPSDQPGSAAPSLFLTSTATPALFRLKCATTATRTWCSI